MGDLTWEGVCKTYPDGTEAVAAVSLAVPAGEFVVLVGPSGCGKTTLLRLTAGLDELTAGRIKIAGRDMARVSAKDRNVAMVFQDYALYPFKSVYENLAFSLRMRRTPAKEIDARVKNVAQRLELTALLNRLPKQLSGGQQQRVGLGRALIRKPDVFLFDEPLSNLDASLRRDMRRDIKAIHRETRTTVVYVTHDQEEAMSLADRLVVMRNGSVLQTGSPAEVYARPTDRFVASIFGSPPMNFLTGTVCERETFVWQSDDGAAVVEFSPLSSLRAFAGRRLVAGFRAEHLRPGTGAAGLRMKVRVAMVESFGPFVDVTFRLPGGAFVTARLAGASSLQEPDVVDLFASEQDLRWFADDEQGSAVA